jgi:hypothetical protein
MILTLFTDKFIKILGVFDYISAPVYPLFDNYLNEVFFCIQHV